MDTFRKILVAIDLSEASVDTLSCAANLVENLKAELIIANIINQRDVDTFKNLADKTTYSLAEFLKHRERDRSEKIQTLIEEVGCQNLPITKIIRTGVPFRKLTEIVDEEGADLVVMGATGRGKLEGVLFGSNAGRMFRHCQIPLLIVRRRAENERPNHSEE